MDQKQLEQRVSELAEVIIRPRDNPAIEGKSAYSKTGDNVGIIVQRILPVPTTCVDCSRHLPEHPRRSFSRRGDQWREYCSGCNRFRDTKTGEFPSVKKRLDLEPSPPQHTEPQSEPTEPETILCFHEQVIERDYRGSLIREFVRSPVEIQLHPVVAQGSDSEVHKDSREHQD